MLLFMISYCMLYISFTCISSVVPVELVKQTKLFWEENPQLVPLSKTVLSKVACNQQKVEMYDNALLFLCTVIESHFVFFVYPALLLPVFPGLFFMAFLCH